MKRTIGWIVAVVLGILLLAALILPWVFGGAGYGMHPYGGMMGRDFGYMHPMGWAGMGLGWLFLLAILALLGLGIASLIKYLTEPRSHQNSAGLAKEIRNCSNCGKPSQPDWSTCPYCGNSLKESQ
jgi:hypothetical protein